MHTPCFVLHARVCRDPQGFGVGHPVLEKAAKIHRIEIPQVSCKLYVGVSERRFAADSWDTVHGAFQHVLLWRPSSGPVGLSYGSYPAMLMRITALF